jgi:hypothetical protein
MSGAIAGWYNDPQQGNVSLAAKILCRRGSPILAELLMSIGKCFVENCRASAGPFTRNRGIWDGR